MLKQYRKKPVVIEAIQLKWGGSVSEIIDFVGPESIEQDEQGTLFIKTLEGDMKVSVNVYIIKGIKGEFYPCKPDIFGATYDEVECSHRNVERWNHGYNSRCRDCGEDDV